MAPEHHIRIDGTLKPRSRFLGNSAASLMEGIAILSFLNRGKEKGGERYILTQPNMYARGILFGKMKYELGDHSFVKCPENGLTADLEFKTKGYFSGTYNAIGGVIKNEKTGETLYELSGLWNGEMYIKDALTGKKELLFNATKAKHASPLTRPLEEQGPRESQKLWYSTVQGLHARNHEVATEEKTKVEDRQREEAAKRAEEGVEWQPKLFRRVQGGPGGSEEGQEDLDWILNAQLTGDTPKAVADQILAIVPILPGQKQSKEFEIPPHKQKEERPAPPPPANNGMGNNLIDFDDHPPPAQAQHKAVSDVKGRYADEPESLHSTGGVPAGLQAPLIPDVGHPIKRQDTNSGEVDEFVDAEEV